MRKILWVVIILVCLIPITFIALALLHAPSKTLLKAQNDFIEINRNYIDNKNIDVSTINTDDSNGQFVRMYAELLNSLMTQDARLAQVRNNLYVLAQAASQTTSQGVYELGEKQASYEKEIVSAENDKEAAYGDLVEKTKTLERKDLKVIDVVTLAESIEKDKTHRQQEVTYYMALSKRIKGIIDLIKTRTGYFQAGPTGSITFTRPEDQQYYKELVEGVNTYAKKIDDLRQEDNMQYRKWVLSLPAATGGK